MTTIIQDRAVSYYFFCIVYLQQDVDNKACDELIWDISKEIRNRIFCCGFGGNIGGACMHIRTQRGPL